MAKLRIPDGVKLWGTNLCCDVTTFGVGVGGWRLMWGANWNWEGFVKPQIDLMVGNRVGCNAIRVQGAAYAVQKGLIPMATYLARWSQLIEYCASLGVYVYPCGCTSDDDLNLNLAPATMGAVFGQIFRHHQQYENVTCIDIIQELHSLTAGPAEWPALKAKLAPLRAAIKAEGVTIPLTFSTGEFLDSGYPWLLQMADEVDYWDVHSYYNAPPSNAWDGLLAARPDYDIVVGEVGAEAGWTTAAGQITAMRRVLDFANQGHPRFRGALIWCSSDPADPAITPGKAWGQYAWDNVARQDRLQLIRRYTKGSRRRASMR